MASSAPFGLHSGYKNATLRLWQSCGTEVAPHNLMLPLFITDESPDAKQDIGSLPGVSRWGIKSVVDFLAPIVADGLSSVLLFGVPERVTKDEVGEVGATEANPVMEAVRNIRAEFPGLTIACDVCLCPYTTHGHCGVLHQDGSINNPATLPRLAAQALAFAKAGADIVAPSDMMDGRVGAIKNILAENGLGSKVSVLSYSVKFSSSFYGPFRDAAKSAPAFGDRKCYQLPCGSRGLAHRAAARDVTEGADMLMVKPGLAYLDVVRDIKNAFPHHPMFIYQVSGEFAMLHHAAAAGAINLEATLMEVLTSMRRAGVDMSSSSSGSSSRSGSSESVSLGPGEWHQLVATVGEGGAALARLGECASGDWQTGATRLADRGKHLLDTGVWSDCEFIVGISPNMKIFHCHKLLLAMASPVFEAMFYGGLAETRREIKIPDVQPEAFSALLSYIYTDKVNLSNFELVCDICYAANKYMLPDLVEECTQFLWRDVNHKNACRALEFARLFEEPVLLEKALHVITHQTLDIVEESSWEEVDRTTLVTVLSKDHLAAPESVLFDAMDRWAARECDRRGVKKSGDNKRTVLSEAVYLIRYLSLSAAEFAAGPAQSGILLQQESFSILMNISCPGSWELPEHMARIAEPRREPGRGSGPMEGATGHILTDCGKKHWCKRAMMQEPHCLNTSILDCSVTFTVDKDVYIHGIEVPSQVTDVPEQAMLENLQPPVEGLPRICQSKHGYNELLYAHLLDGDGQRLTYTHFTAKVNWNSMIEISFNRSVLVNANKVYRIGMVLNKVGWYPMGVCTRRVNTEGAFFTFCVGQPNDTHRDGLIRSIIFSRLENLWSN